MEFFKNNLDSDITDEYFSNIQNSDFLSLSHDDKVLMIETSITNSIKDCDVIDKLKFFEQVIVNTIKKSISHENIVIRQFSIYLTLASFQLGQEYFEPYLNSIMPELLSLLEDKHRDVVNIALEVYKMADDLKNIKIVGIDLHIGSQITDILPFETAFIKIANFIKRLRVEGYTIDRVDIGGGLGISYSTQEDDPISLDKFS